jgi:hypothetical protein
MAVKPTQAQIDTIYMAYPRKVGCKAAKKSIIRALREVPYDQLLSIVQAYAEAVEGREKRYIPIPTTFFNQGRYLDDPAEWNPRNEVVGSKRVKPGDPNYFGSAEYYEEMNRRRKES